MFLRSFLSAIAIAVLSINASAAIYTYDITGRIDFSDGTLGSVELGEEFRMIASINTETMSSYDGSFGPIQNPINYRIYSPLEGDFYIGDELADQSSSSAGITIFDNGPVALSLDSFQDNLFFNFNTVAIAGRDNLTLRVGLTQQASNPEMLIGYGLEQTANIEFNSLTDTSLYIYEGETDWRSEDYVQGYVTSYQVIVSEVPLPAGIWLFGSALSLLAGLKLVGTNRN